MKRTIKISYEWWRSDGKRMRPEHREALEEMAEERIGEMMQEGYSSGQLTDNVHMDDNDPPDGVEYTGWWEVKKK